MRGERLVAVLPHGQRTPDLDLGNAAILPGLVNAHTHLDLSGLRGRCPPGEDFTDWLRAVVHHRRTQTLEQVSADVRAGLAESLACGTTLLGDIAGAGLSWQILAQAPLRAIVFYELLGLTRLRAEQALQAACDWLAAHSAVPTCRPAFSPHAPYSVRVQLFRESAALAQQHNVPLAVHLAETLAEMQLLQERRGPLRTFLEELGVWDEEDLARSSQEVLTACAAAPQLLLAHGNYLPSDGRLPAHTTVVYCPRTHAAFGHPPHPFRDFLKRGVRIAVGTDSLASNPDLDVLAEIRFLHRHYPDVPGETLLRMATLSGAEALGWADETGSLTPGKSADLLVLPLPDEEASDPHRLVLGAATRVQAVLCRGRWVGAP
jgi:cytosine/adenosine deaminase-related metal-dependent hydrolase